MKRKELRFEHSDWECERGHKLYKVFEPEQKHVHMLLCAQCDRDVIQKMEKKINGES